MTQRAHHRSSSRRAVVSRALDALAEWGATPQRTAHAELAADGLVTCGTGGRS